METRPSTPEAPEKPVPVPNRRWVGVFIKAGLIGLGLGLLGGFAAGRLAFQLAAAQYPGLELGILLFGLVPVTTLPIAGLCTGLIAAALRSARWGSVAGAVIFGGSQLILCFSLAAEAWKAVAMLTLAAAVFGAWAGAGAGALSEGPAGFDPGSI